MSKHDVPVLAIVTFPTPKEIDRAAMRALIEEAGPNYINIPGLRRKCFIAGDGVGGGVYEWDSRRTAEAFYGEEWYAAIQERFDAVPQIVFYDAAGIADGIAHKLEVF